MTVEPTAAPPRVAPPFVPDARDVTPPREDEPTRRLPRVLGVGFGVAVAVGSMVGAGILRAPADVAALLPRPALFLGVWVLGGVYALLGANALAELGAMHPRSGGQYVFARRAFGPFAGFVVGWNDWVSSCASVAVISLVLAGAVGALAPAAAPHESLVALGVVAAVTLLLLRGVRAGDRAQRATSVVKGLVLLALVVACFAYAATHGAPPPPSPSVPDAAAAPSRHLALLAALVVALQGVIFAYDGWVGVLYFAEELPDPGRQVARSLFGGVLSTMALYVLVNVAFLAVLALPEIARSTLPAASAAARVFGGPPGAAVVNAIVVAALPSAAIANTLMGSRVAFGLGRDASAPGWLGRAGESGTPRAAILVTAALTAAFLLTGTFERVVALCSFLFVAGYTASFAAVFVLRRREPLVPRPYRAWGHPWTTGAVLAGSLAFLAGTLAADVRDGLIALGLVVASYPVYRLLRRSKSDEGAADLRG